MPHAGDISTAVEIGPVPLDGVECRQDVVEQAGRAISTTSRLLRGQLDDVEKQT